MEASKDTRYCNQTCNDFLLSGRISSLEQGASTAISGACVHGKLKFKSGTTKNTGKVRFFRVKKKCKVFSKS